MVVTSHFLILRWLQMNLLVQNFSKSSKHSVTLTIPLKNNLYKDFSVKKLAAFNTNKETIILLPDTNEYFRILALDYSVDRLPWTF